MGATNGLKALFPPTTKKPKSQGQEPALLATLDLHLLRSSMSLTSWLCVGAAVQAAISLFRIPFYLSLVLILGVLGYRTGHALLITFKLIPNPYLEDAIFNYTSAQIPNRDTGEFSDTPAAEPVGILHLGAKINHPLGAFSPHAQPLIKYAETMYKVLDSDAKKSNGYLGGQSFDTVDKNGCMEFTFISYWRNIEAIHDFAYSSAHRKGWEWWNSVPKEEIKHLGINHEIFEAPAGQWETIYINHQPTLMGATASYRPGDKSIGGTVENSWQSNIMDASRGPLRTSAGRLSRNREELAGRYSYVPKPLSKGWDGDGRDTLAAQGEKVISAVA